MTKLRISTFFLMISIVLWGTLLGGILYSHLVYFPIYLSALPESAVVTTGPYGLREGSFWTLIHALLLPTLIVTVLLNWKWKTRRKLIAITLLLYSLALIATALYFVPELIAFANSPNSTVSRAEWLARGQRWQVLSWIRGVFMYAGIVPLLLALAKPVDGAGGLQE
jgi:phosphoglycerol transferase MdoB-like AlkP superfamily enzyme